MAKRDLDDPCQGKHTEGVDAVEMQIEIGCVGTAQMPDLGQRLLDCDDTYPDFEQAREWKGALLDNLERWLCGDINAIPALGQSTPTKHWLVGLLRFRLTLMGYWSRFVGGSPSGNSERAELRTT